MGSTVRPEDTVVLLGSGGERYVVQVRDETRRVGGLGVVPLQDLIGRTWGERVKLGFKEYLILAPILSDHLRALERGPQIILPKDAARIVFELGLGAGKRVIEGGVGSGALTLALAHAVAPTGRVYAYDTRPEHLEVARRNLGRAGLAAVVEFRTEDVHTMSADRDVDACAYDVPDPELAVPAARRALRPGGAFAAYTPLVGQAEAVVRALRESAFVDVRTLELLERSWVLHDRGARPDFSMLGHTGFLTFARRP